MTITLNFPDSKAAFIIELLQNLKFVHIEKDEDLSDWHKEILDERNAEYEQNPNDLIDWVTIQKDSLTSTL